MTHKTKKKRFAEGRGVKTWAMSSSAKVILETNP